MNKRRKNYSKYQIVESRPLRELANLWQILRPILVSGVERQLFEEMQWNSISRKRAICYFFLFYFILFIYLFLTVLGLHCCSDFSLVAQSRGYSLVVVCGLLIVVASLVAEPRLCEEILMSFSEQIISCYDFWVCEWFIYICIKFS